MQSLSASRLFPLWIAGLGLAAITLLSAAPAVSQTQPLPGVTLELKETSLDLTDPAKAILTGTLENHSSKIVNVMVEMMEAIETPIFLTADGHELACTVGPMSWNMDHGFPIELHSGKTQKFFLGLSNYICPQAIEHATSI